MSVLIKKLIKGYLYVNNELSDPRVHDLPLMTSPFSVLIIIGAYLYFVLKLGPELMKHRKPFKLDKIIIGFNIFQIIACLFLTGKFVQHAMFRYNWRCEPVDYSNTPMALKFLLYVWIYFAIKLFDLLDTVFFVLRKKSRQISFLHVYHHAGMVMLTWIGTKYLGGGHSLYLGFINCIVHIVMYFYYLLTAWDEKYKKSIWWKKHITQIQMIQFFLLIIIYGQILFQDCNYSKCIVVLLLAQDLFIFSLFLDFYIKEYVRKKVPAVTESQAVMEGTNKDKEK